MQATFSSLTDPVRALRRLQILGQPEDSRTSRLKVCTPPRGASPTTPRPRLCCPASSHRRCASKPSTGPTVHSPERCGLPDQGEDRRCLLASQALYKSHRSVECDAPSLDFPDDFVTSHLSRSLDRTHAPILMLIQTIKEQTEHTTAADRYPNEKNTLCWDFRKLFFCIQL